MPRLRLRLHSVAVRLGLALAVVVAGALGVVWVALVPTLERRLVDAKLHQIESSARAVSRDARTTVVNADFVDEAAHTSTARVVYFTTASGGGQTTLFSVFDSEHLAPGIARDPVALRAAERLVPTHGRVTRGGDSYIEAAVPDADGDVFLFSASLRDTLATVDLVSSRLVWAGLIALGLALVVGLAAAAAFAARIRRLERAAERIAGGHFDEPVVDHGADEVGELASAFDRMRLRLAQLDDARRAFIANASHELRTPIFSLGGFLELLQDEELDAVTRHEFLATMAEQVQRLSKLATDLLDLSRLDAGPVRLETEPVSLAELAAGLRDEFAAVARQHAHPLEAVVEGDGQVLADRERALQAGRALVDNALLHTPAGTPVRLVVRGSTLAVEDDGPGIPPEHHEQVFARFTRLGGSRASGTGLGLAIARELAQRMGGSLSLASRPGRTVFSLELPPAGADDSLRADRHEEAVR